MRSFSGPLRAFLVVAVIAMPALAQAHEGAGGTRQDGIRKDFGRIAAIGQSDRAGKPVGPCSLAKLKPGLACESDGKGGFRVVKGRADFSALPGVPARISTGMKPVPKPRPPKPGIAERLAPALHQPPVTEGLVTDLPKNPRLAQSENRRQDAERGGNLRSPGAAPDWKGYENGWKNEKAPVADRFRPHWPPGR